MKWKEIVVATLARRQGGRCADCGGGIKTAAETRVKTKKNGSADLDNLKLVHRDCSRSKPEHELVKVQIDHLLSKNEHPKRIADILGISERTVWRHKARRSRGT